MSGDTNYKKLYKESRLEIIKLRQANEVMAEKMEEMAKAIKDLQARLAVYDNYNTPPSQKRPAPKPKGGSSNGGGTGRKQGGQKGHPGKTSRPKPTAFQEHMPTGCPDCGSQDLEVTGTRKRDITDVRRTATVTTTRHSIHTCRCGRCGRGGIIPDTKGVVPVSGNYGTGVVLEAASHYESRMPVRMIAGNMARASGLMVSTGAVRNILYRLGTGLAGSADAVLESMRRARVLNGDETSIRVGGVNYWIWILHNPKTGDFYYTIREHRDSAVLKSLLPGWEGTMVCDGWPSYKFLERVQRCWAHMIREARDLAEKHPDSREAADVLARLRRIFEDAKQARPARKRQHAHDLLAARIRRLIERYSDYHVVEKFMKKLGRALPELFLFVLDPRIPPTNNAAERGLRELVVHRKVRGGLRSDDTDWLSNIFTCIMTWKERRLDWMAEMAKYV